MLHLLMYRLAVLPTLLAALAGPGLHELTHVGRCPIHLQHTQCAASSCREIIAPSKQIVGHSQRFYHACVKHSHRVAPRQDHLTQANRPRFANSSMSILPDHGDCHICGLLQVIASTLCEVPLVVESDQTVCTLLRIRPTSPTFARTLFPPSLSRRGPPDV